MAFAQPAITGFGGLPRVNLMPRVEIERRQRSTLIRRWLRGVIAALAVVALLAGAAFWLQTTAAVRNAITTQRTNTLLSEVAALAPVRGKLELRAELEGYRAQAMGTDLRWSALLATVERALPSGVTVAGFSLAPGGLLAAGEDPLAETGAEGTLALSSETPAEIVRLIRALRPLDGVLEVDGWEVAVENGVYTYVLRIAYDQSVYTGAYTLEEDSQ
ncbi:hypothetical protein [uncultured Microbacterium sp.]|uniref:Fimbrial assembly family protein n=1 Tax=uncultured Microbacterium sp. TaxID=191216 RepID=A0A1Y5P618_9MICO|nr:hypothetical protein [uncultured Microbacterium sp.]SBS74113.1 hypothetical protein MIPYR_50196 [uncultured Microbacterium sp.]